MLTDLLQTSYFAIFLIVALGFMLGRIKVMGQSLDVSAVIFIALAFGHWGGIHSKGTGNLRAGVVYLYDWYSGRSGFLPFVPEQGKNLDSDYAADSGFCLPDRGRNEISF